jgi:hypothetical protein
MNAREAKQEACRRAASVIETAMASGWPAYDDGAGRERYSESDGERVVAALNNIIDELGRRGGLAPRDSGSSS